MINSAICRSWAALDFVVFSMEYRYRSIDARMHSKFAFRDGTAIYTYTLEEQEDGTMKRSVLDLRTLDHNKDVMRENPEFNNLVCCTQTAPLKRSIAVPSTRTRVH